MPDIRALLKRHDDMKSARSNWDSMWEEVAKRIFPRGDDFRDRHPRGTQRTQQQFDAWPMLALDRFAAALENGLTPRNSYWHRLSTGNEELDEDTEVARYLEELNRRLWRTRYAPRSNFASQMHEIYLSLGAFGTGCMLTENRPPKGVRYKAIHLGELYIAENSDGMIDTVHREFELTARQALQRFGMAALPDRVEQKIRADRMDEADVYVHVVMPREDYDRGALDQRSLPFTDIYIHRDTKQVVRDAGFYEMPYAVSRYVTSTREIYGRGVGVTLLPDIKMLQEMRYVTLEAANMLVDPPVFLHDDGSLSEFRMTPGARNFGGVDEQGRPLWSTYQGGAPEIGLEMIQDTKQQIDNAFLGVYFRVLLENPSMTATQALLIAQQQGQMTAPLVGRQQSELLGPLIRRESGILFRQGRHPEMPAKLAEYLEAERESLEIEYESPLTRAARAEEGVAVLRTFESLAPFAQVDPNVFRRFNVGEVARLVADVNGVPSKVLYSDEEMDALDEQQAAQQAAAAALDAAPVAAQTAKTLSDIQRQSQNAPQPVGQP